MSRRVLLVGVMVAAVAAIIWTFGPKPAPCFVWNLSPSVPVGLYRVAPVSRLAVTDLVIARPPEPLAAKLARAAYLPRGVPLIKRIRALSGDVVCRIGLHMTINGIAEAPARERDHLGRLLPSWNGCRVIGEGEVFLMNWDELDSLDGRYFGPLPAVSIIGRAIPLWTDEDGTGRYEWRAPTR